MLSPARRILIAPLFAALLIAIMHSAASAGPTPTPATVRIDPVNQTVAAGAELTFDVTVEGITDPDGLGGYEVSLFFDPSLLEFKSYDNGPFLGSTGRALSCVPHLFDEDGDGEPDPGFVRVGCVSFGLNPPGPMGDGTLGTFVFNTLCAGNSDLAIDLVGLSDPSGNGIPEMIASGAVTIEGAPCATPTPTPAGLVGDANCSGNVDPIDAAIVLQLTAGLIESVGCPTLADVNDDGSPNAVDSALILQFVAGIITSLT